MKMLTDERLKVGADLAAYLAAGGGRGLEAALAAPASIIASIEAASGALVFQLIGNGRPSPRKLAPGSGSSATETKMSRERSRTAFFWSRRPTRSSKAR